MSNPSKNFDVFCDTSQQPIDIANDAMCEDLRRSKRQKK